MGAVIPCTRLRVNSVCVCICGHGCVCVVVVHASSKGERQETRLTHWGCVFASGGHTVLLRSLPVRSSVERERSVRGVCGLRAVVQLLHLVDAHQPVLRRVRLSTQAHTCVGFFAVTSPLRRLSLYLLYGFEGEVLVSNLCVAHTVPTGRSLVLRHHFAKAIIAHLVHQRVEHLRGTLAVNAELTCSAHTCTDTRQTEPG